MAHLDKLRFFTPGTALGHNGLRVFFASWPASSQSDPTESVAFQAVVLKLDLEGVEAQLRVLAERRARVEAELLHTTCEVTFSRRQQRRQLSLRNTARMPTLSNTALSWTFLVARHREVFPCEIMQ